MEDKKKIREELSQKRRGVSEADRAAFNEMLFVKTVSCNAFKNADVILAYYPVKNEPDILKIVDTALKLRKKVAFPISDKDTYELTFRYISDLSELKPGAYSIPEPSCDSELYVNVPNTLCIVPALAFDRDGYRIGYGKGFYDRFLSSFEGYSIGLCYHEFLCDKLPTEKTDKKVNMIITNKEVLYV